MGLTRLSAPAMLAARYLAVGADVGMVRTSRPRGQCGARGVGDDSSDRFCPPVSVRTTSKLRSESSTAATGRRLS